MSKFRYLVLLAVLLLMIPMASAHMPWYRHGHRYCMCMKHMNNKTRKMIISMINTSRVEFTNTHEGNLFTYLHIPGVFENITVTLRGYGSMLGPSNSTEYINVSNGTVVNLNLSYYPRNVTLDVIGFSWWNNTNQKIVNNTGAVISNAPISESDGSFTVSDDYTSYKPIWQSKSANLTVNTTAGWIGLSSDTVAETVSVVYNITINDGYFTSMTWHNVSLYVAPNTTLGTGQDDLKIYYSTDGGKTWTEMYAAADGSTSPGTQWTGNINLPIAGNKSVLINVTFISDGADDAAGQPDVHLNAIDITGTVSKLPTRNPAVYIYSDGEWHEYNNTTGMVGLANGTSISFYLGNDTLNLTNKIKFYAEGSQRMSVKLTWNDENRTAIRIVQLAGKVYNVTTLFLANNQTHTFDFTNAKHCGLIPFWVYVDPHSRNEKFSYTFNVSTFKWMCVMGGRFVVDPQLGMSLEKMSAAAKPLPIFIKPEKYPCTCNVTWFDPNASGVNSTVLNMTASSTHGNVVHFLISNITNAKNVSLYVDGVFRRVIPVYNDTCYFNWSNWSEHVIALKVYGTSAAMVAPPSHKFDIWDIVALVFIIAIAAAIVGLVYEIIKGRIR